MDFTARPETLASTEQVMVAVLLRTLKEPKEPTKQMPQAAEVAQRGAVEAPQRWQESPR